MTTTITQTLEQKFIEFAAALKLARTGDGSKLPIDAGKDEKSSILALNGLVVYTLTKKGNLFQRNLIWCQFRVWVRNPRLNKNGNHADGYDHGCIFNVIGPFEELKNLAEKHLTEQKMKR